MAMTFSLLGFAVSGYTWIVLQRVSHVVPPVFIILYFIAFFTNIRHLLSHPPSRSSSPALYSVIVLGSGGHTKEMLYMLSNGFRAHPRSHRRYIVSSGDRLSVAHLTEWEASTAASFPNAGTFDIVTVPRARRVHQSLLTTPFSAAASLAMLIPALLTRPCARADLGLPDIIVTNGPATGFFTVLAAFIMRALGLVSADKMRSLYVESWARIKSLSVTGKLFRVSGIADRFVVQHSAVAEKYGLENGGWLVIGRAS
ncbi:hypothetical protein TD95_004582 [Thielaviopsis punctulata]|uniref:UDP-N-acetylglucosamine transferase subunit ALG14 n=1 Tax=Thielaviopsis punctulata TaxID=72032 RepID=A0A0F4ZIG4_9PEZI|nr:hypothetical protein TD95_004582 [Thielaviopsis punctulata]